jgi:hypothetical protein
MLFFRLLTSVPQLSTINITFPLPAFQCFTKQMSWNSLAFSQRALTGYHPDNDVCNAAKYQIQPPI